MEVLVKLEVYNEVKEQAKVKDEQFGILCKKKNVNFGETKRTVSVILLLDEFGYIQIYMLTKF